MSFPLNRVLGSGQLTEQKPGRGGMFGILANGNDLIPVFFPESQDLPAIGQEIAIDGTWVGRRFTESDGTQRVRCYVTVQHWSCLANQQPARRPAPSSRPPAQDQSVDSGAPAPTEKEPDPLPAVPAQDDPADMLEPVSEYDVIPENYEELLETEPLDEDPPSSCSHPAPMDEQVPDIDPPQFPNHHQQKEVVFHGPEKPF